MTWAEPPAVSVIEPTTITGEAVAAVVWLDAGPLGEFSREPVAGTTVCLAVTTVEPMVSSSSPAGLPLWLPGVFSLFEPAADAGYTGPLWEFPIEPGAGTSVCLAVTTVEPMVSNISPGGLSFWLPGAFPLFEPLSTLPVALASDEPAAEGEGVCGTKIGTAVAAGFDAVVPALLPPSLLGAP